MKKDSNLLVLLVIYFTSPNSSILHKEEILQTFPINKKKKGNNS